MPSVPEQLRLRNVPESPAACCGESYCGALGHRRLSVASTSSSSVAVSGHVAIDGSFCWALAEREAQRPQPR